MSDLLRMTGMVSGMDTESIVQSLVETKRKSVTKIKNEQTKLEWKQTAWQDLNKKIYSLYSSTLSNMRLTGSYSKKKTTCSDATKATVIASDSAVNGTQTLEIKQLAKAGYLTGAKISPKKVTENGTTKEVNWTKEDKMTAIDSGLKGTKLKITVGNGADAKETEIEITDDMTIDGFTNKLKEAGVNASFDEKYQRFFISSKDTGLAKEFQISAEGNPDALKKLGIDENEADCTRIKAQDAEIVLNNATFTSDTNTFTVNGLTIQATGLTTEEITINTTTDYDGIYDMVKDFISEYNEIINDIYQKYNADSASKYDVLSAEEKEQMTDDEVEKWEGKIKDSLLRRDSNLYSIMNTLTSTMSASYYRNNLTEAEKKKMTQKEIDDWYKENGGEKLSLYDFGIDKLSYFEAEDNERQAYHIDGDPDDDHTSTEKDKLKAAISKDPEGTIQFFANLCGSLYKSIDAMMERTDYRSIYKVYDDKRLKSEYDDYTKKIAEAEKKVNAYEDKWYDKFSAMEVALSKLQSNQNAVSSMLGM